MKIESYKYQRFIPGVGESRWADSAELKSADTIRQIGVTEESCLGCGMPVISDGKMAYIDDSDTHTMVFGATGSKKTRLFGMPMINMFALAGESFIATDPKGELFQKTSGLVAAKGYKTITLDFRDLANSSYWNPLELPYVLYHGGRTEEAVELLNDFLGTLAAPQRKGAKDPYWIELGSSMAVAFMLFFIETSSKEEANIYNFANFFAAKSSPESTAELFRYVAEGSVAAVNLSGILNNKDAKMTFGNVAAGVSNMVNPFVIRKSLCQILSKSSFDVRDIGNTKTAIYIIVPDEKTTLHFLVTAFIKQVYEALIGEAQKQESKKLPVRLNFLLDEFCNIPTIPDMASMISAARSRNMRFYLMAQGMFQLKQKYGDDANTIRGNCDNWVFLASREYELLKEISDLCGETTYKDLDGGIKTRPLISISELQRLKKDTGEALILHGRQYPFMATLPDIDEYSFITYPPAVTKQKRQLPKIVPYDIENVISEIKNKKRPITFSAEVFGKKKYYEKNNSPYGDAFDW